jgi:succinate dehydrogenase/fumarate reductase flavoprotein subunit
MATPSSSYDVVILGSGIAGLAGALAAHKLGLQPLVLEKAAALGGGTVHSYGLIWVGQNYLAREAGIATGPSRRRPTNDVIRTRAGRLTRALCASAPRTAASPCGWRYWLFGCFGP